MLHLLTGLCFGMAPTPVVPAHATLPVRLGMAPAVVAAVAPDTNRSVFDTATIPLSEELLKNYEGVRTDMKAFWAAHPALKDSAAPGIVTVNVNFTGKGLESHPDTVREYNYVALAAREPAIAGVFSAHHLAPAQYIPVTVTAWRALYIVQLSQTSGVPVTEDSASVLGKNVALAKARLADLQGVALGWHFQRQGGGGGGDDLNP